VKAPEKKDVECVAVTVEDGEMLIECMECVAEAHHVGTTTSGWLLRRYIRAFQILHENCRQNLIERLTREEAHAKRCAN